MKKKTIVIILSVLVAAATAAIELLSSCASSTRFERVTPADSVYYERSFDLYRKSLSCCSFQRVSPHYEKHPLVGVRGYLKD